MRTIEGYLEKGRFYPIGQTGEIRGRRRVLVTVLNDNISKVLDDEKTNKRTVREAWLKKLHAAIDLAQDEDFPLLTRSKEMRPPHNLSDSEGG